MKLNKKLVGQKYVEGVIDVTDPCYDKDEPCRINATVKAGTYDCVVWKEPDSVYSKIRAIGIYLDGKVLVQEQMQKIGSICVDTGLAGFFKDKPDYTDEQWIEFCEFIREGDAWIKDEGFFSVSGDGDGEYSVYAYKQEDEITALEIRF